MALTLNQLVKASGLSTSVATTWLPWFNLAIEAAHLDTNQRIAGFLAQALHETGSLRYLRELWGPTDTQKGYEGRTDLGNNQPGDGFKFRGRGIFQITGRANYQQVCDSLGVDCVNHPELLEQPEWAMKSAILYWNTRKRNGLSLNQLCDNQDFLGLTKAINGGINGLDDRKARYNQALRGLTSA